MKESIVITGGAGFLGVHIVRRLLAGRNEGCSIKVIENMTFSASAYAGKSFSPSGFEFIRCDMTSRNDFMKAAAGADTIIHLARSEDPLKTSDLVDYNCSMTENIAAFSQSNDVKAILLSSSFQVYGANAAENIKEDAPCAPITPYAHSKKLCELILQDTAQRTGSRAAILRYFNIYGPGAGTGILKMLKGHVESGAADICLHNDGFDGRDYIHVDDAANAAILALRRLSGKESMPAAEIGSCEIVNAGTGRCTTVRQLIEMAGEQIGSEFRPRYGSGQDPIRAISADCRKIQSMLGFWPAIDLEEGLKRLFNENL